MVLQAYAKINIGLRIIERRRDGFHAIETIFHRINCFDTIILEAAPRGIALTCSDPSLPVDDSNLCWRAVEALQQECGTTLGAVIHLHKQIPSGAGLGGGSSDAASILRALPSLWKLSVPLDRLHALGAAIGSDVPFFLQDASAYAEGRGELLTPCAVSIPYWILLVNPGIHVSTPWAYREFSAKLAAGLVVPRGTLFSNEEQRAHELSSLLVNDFEDVVFPVYPEIAALKNELRSSGASYALMSGSGSSVFGLFEKEDDARAANAAMEQRYFTSLTEPFFIPG
jgi:4-diphosphocytidyl-2-C-methyl-D-erythritol kinase